MKNIGCQILILLLGFFFSCTSQHKETLLPELIHAETLMYAHPDSALYLLESMPMPYPSDELQNATWSLLLVQARDKNYITHSSDSLINVAYDYFIKQTDPQRKALVLNYKGRVNADLGEAEKATEYYLQARDEVKKTNDYQLSFLIHANQGMLYAYRSLNDLAMSAIQEAYQYAVQGKDSVYLSMAFTHLGRAYGMNEQWDKSLASYKNAAQVAREIKNDQSLSWALKEISDIYLRIGYSDSALLCLKETISLDTAVVDIPQVHLGFGDTYRRMGEYESAIVHLKKALLSDNIYTKQVAYQCLYLTYKAKKDFDNLVENNDLYWIYRDSIDRIHQSDAIIGIQAKYNQEKLKNENMELVVARNRILKNSLLILILLITLIGIIVYIYQRRLLRKEQTIRQNEVLSCQYLSQLQENELTISNNEERIHELEEEIKKQPGKTDTMDEQAKEIEILRKQNARLQQDNTNYQSNIETYAQTLADAGRKSKEYETLLKENTRLQARTKYLTIRLLKQTDILQQLRVSQSAIKDEMEWASIIEAIDMIYDNFSLRLQKECPSLTESDIQVCCLIKLRLNNDAISTLLGISNGSVNKRKQRLRERINNDLKDCIDKKQLLEVWIGSY